VRSRAALGFTDFAPEERAALPPVAQPLVLTHPRTGGKSIYVASHALHILDMAVAEGRLLMELIERATHANATYRHEWQIGDLVLRDNRRSMHRGLPFDVRRGISSRPAARGNVRWLRAETCQSPRSDGRLVKRGSVTGTTDIWGNLIVRARRLGSTTPIPDLAAPCPTAVSRGRFDQAGFS
jgi:hypothetical protein